MQTACKCGCGRAWSEPEWYASLPPADEGEDALDPLDALRFVYEDGCADKWGVAKLAGTEGLSVVEEDGGGCTRQMAIFGLVDPDEEHYRYSANAVGTLVEAAVNALPALINIAESARAQTNHRTGCGCPMCEGFRRLASVMATVLPDDAGEPEPGGDSGDE